MVSMFYARLTVFVSSYLCHQLQTGVNVCTQNVICSPVTTHLASYEGWAYGSKRSSRPISSQSNTGMVRFNLYQSRLCETNYLATR